MTSPITRPKTGSESSGSTLSDHGEGAGAATPHTHRSVWSYDGAHYKRSCKALAPGFVLDAILLPLRTDLMYNRVNTPDATKVHISERQFNGYKVLILEELMEWESTGHARFLGADKVTAWQRANHPDSFESSKPLYAGLCILISEYQYPGEAPFGFGHR